MAEPGADNSVLSVVMVIHILFQIISNIYILDMHTDDDRKIEMDPSDKMSTTLSSVHIPKLSLPIFSLKKSHRPPVDNPGPVPHKF